MKVSTTEGWSLLQQTLIPQLISVYVLQSAVFVPVCRCPLTGSLAPHVLHFLCGSSWRPPATAAGSHTVPSSRAAALAASALSPQPAPLLLHLPGGKGRALEASGPRPHQPISELSASLGAACVCMGVFKPLVSDL